MLPFTEIHSCPLPLSPAFKLIAECTIRPAPERSARWHETITRLAHELTDWGEVLRLVRRHQVPVLVEDALKKNLDRNFAAIVPPDLEIAARHSRMNALLQIAECRRIAERFAQAGIGIVQLKGAPLSQRLYGDPTLRSCGDVDLLIDWSSLQESIAILQRMQYTLLQSAPCSRRISDLITRHAYHDCSLVNANTRLHLELHWRASAWSSRASADLIRECTPDPQFGPAMPPEIPEMVDLLTHGTGHYWVRIKWLSDIQQAALHRTGDFWNDVVHLASEMGALATVRIAAILAGWIFAERAPALANIAMTASRRDLRAARYAMSRIAAPLVHPTDARSTAAKTWYRVATCTPYQLLTTALRCVQPESKREAAGV